MRAQFTPQEYSDWADPRDELSSFHGERMIVVQRPQIAQANKALQVVLRQTVGGFMGMCCTSVSNSKITLEKGQYSIGEEIRVRIVSDNRACSCEIFSYKLCLIRTYFGRADRVVDSDVRD